MFADFFLPGASPQTRSQRCLGSRLCPCSLLGLVLLGDGMGLTVVMAQSHALSCEHQGAKSGTSSVLTGRSVLAAVASQAG